MILASAVQTPGQTRQKNTGSGKRTLATGKELQLRQKTCEMLDTEVFKSTTQMQL